MKKAMALTSVLVLLMVCLIPVFSLAVGNVYYVKTSNGKNLTVRENPWKTDDNVKGTIPYGTEVTVMEYTNSTWWLVQPANWSNPGYVMSSFLVSYYPGAYVPSSNPTTTTTTTSISYDSFKHVEPYQLKVKASRSGAVAKLRWAPSKSSKLMETLYSGDTVTVLSEGSQWYQVQDDETGYVGFINTTFLVK